MKRLLFGLALAFGLMLPAHAQIAPAAGYWWNPAQGGNGFVIEIQGSQMFMAGFLYDVSGRASWVASAGPMTSASQYSGSLITYTGGQTLTGAYKGAPTISAPLGNIAITFTSNTQGSIVWPGGTVPIQRFDIIPGGSSAQQAPTNPQTGWWYNQSEGGRGFAVEVQGGNMYLAGYMYDTSGNPIWYLASGAMTNGAFQGQWTQYQNGITLTGAYKAPTLANASVGSVTAQFSSGSNATVTLPDGRQIQLTRYTFGISGPTLSAFAPASAAPASLLAVTGSNINPAATLSFTFSDSTGFSVNVPLAAASSTNLSVSIPPYYNVASGAFGSGTVNLKLTQSANGESADSNTLSGFAIQRLPAVPGTAGQGALSLIRANLSAAQKLQTSIKGTAQDSAAVDTAIATQIADLQSLVTHIGDVVQTGLSYSLGVVGGVNISVTPANIGDVDSLILATLQALGASTGSGEKSAEALTPGCMSAEATAFANAILAGTSGAALDALALALVQAPNTSAACGTVANFATAYQIFGGAGNIGLGITNQAGSSTVASKLPGAALFATTSANANIDVGLNALLSPSLASQATAVQNVISSVTALSSPATNALIAKAVGTIATSLTDSQTAITTVAPTSTSGTGAGTGLVPLNLPLGTYQMAFMECHAEQGGGSFCGSSPQGGGGTNTDPIAFAAFLTSEINLYCTKWKGATCSSTTTPFNGTSYTVVWTIIPAPADVSSDGTSITTTLTITKTG